MRKLLISYPSKRDSKSSPANKAQAVKKLEAAERRLIKNPDVAKAGSSNSKKLMNKLKFAPKLSDVEMKNYKGPVHHVSHHKPQT